MKFEVWTDGSCYPNPGTGGWAFIVIDEDGQPFGRDCGSAPVATNNTMELQAVIEALRYINESIDVEVVTDSAYVANAFRNGWLTIWQRRGWRTSEKKPVANQAKWRELLEIATGTSRSRFRLSGSSPASPRKWSVRRPTVAELYRPLTPNLHWVLGERAHAKGKSRDECPFTYSGSRWEWEAGWDYAESLTLLLERGKQR